jgi:hypothetical protein
VACNEFGIQAKCVIHGVELMNEGWGMGIEDRQADMQTTYLARAVTRWTAKRDGGVTDVGSLQRVGGGIQVKA